MNKGKFALALAALTLVTNRAPTPAFAAESKAAEAKQPKGPSRHLQCDGQPNNTTAGESAARLIGAITLLALFAPTPEAPSPAARKFGAEGVAVCNSLLDGVEGIEGNPVRRLELLLARSIHQIEAKNYDAAIADIKLARSESDAKGFSKDPYFARTIGLSFDLIEAEALVRLGRFDDARTLGLSKVSTYPHSYYPLIAARPYSDFNPSLSAAERERMDRLERIASLHLMFNADRFDEVGEFAQAAKKREALIEYFELLGSKDKMSFIYADAAVSHALAGNWEKADERAKFARDNVNLLQREGRPDSTAARSSETIDLYDILKLAKDGRVKEARRNFAARSRWFHPSLGQVMATNRMLRSGAAPDELFGSLEKTPEQMWQSRHDDEMAAMLESDKNNKTLFGLILPFAKAEWFEALSGQVWKTQKSRLMGKAANEKTKEWTLFIFGQPMTQVDALMLHAALQARHRGLAKFNYSMHPNSPSAASARFPAGGDEKIIEELALDTDAVIAELSAVIPEPEKLKAIKQQRASQKAAR